jgi:hypothetical protein
MLVQQAAAGFILPDMLVNPFMADRWAMPAGAIVSGVILTALQALNLRCNAFCWACLGRYPRKPVLRPNSRLIVLG